jgi:hypothetical protein
MPVWISINGTRMDMTERPEWDMERGVRNVPTWTRAQMLVDIFNKRGFLAEGPFHDEAGRVPGAVTAAA